MLNTLMLYGGKKGPDLGIGQEFDVDSLHYPQPDGMVNVVDAELAQAWVRRPDRSKWSPAFEWRYSLSVWICPHKFVAGTEYQPYLAAFQRPTDATWTQPEVRHLSAWGIEQVTPTNVGGGHGATNEIYIGHTDGSNRYGRVFTIKRRWWTHLFITVDTQQAVPEDRQKVWINGVFAAGIKKQAFWGDLQGQASHGQWPANPFLSRNYPGGGATHPPTIDSQQAQDITFGIGSGGPFWSHPNNLPGLRPNHAGIAAVYFIDDDATVNQIGQNDGVTGIWTQRPLLPRFGGASFYLNFADRTGPQTGQNTNIAKDQLGNTQAVAINARQNISGARNTFRGKVEEILSYPEVK